MITIGFGTRSGQFVSVSRHLAVNAVFRPLDHIRQIPFINQALFTFYATVNFYIYIKEFPLFVPYGIHIACLYSFTFAIHACAVANALTSRLRSHFAAHNGTCWWEILAHAQLLNYRNCQLSLFLFYSKHLWTKRGGSVQHFSNWITVAPALPRRPGSPVFPNFPCKKKKKESDDKSTSITKSDKYKN